MTRFEKMEYLHETCSHRFIKDCTFLQELVRWMDESDFNMFFTHICQVWEIKDPRALYDEEDEEDARNVFTIEDDEIVFTA